MRFGYTPFGKSKHSPGKEHRVLGEAELLARKYGYQRRSVWTVNRRDSPRYTSITREFYLGCGAGAGSFTGQMFVLNHFSVSTYVEKVEQQCLPIARVSQLSAGMAASYYLFWQAYTGTIDTARFDALYPRRRVP
jgi:coproporphyrinogen III oxidase-like Fe-S oxidoreductase